MFRIIQDNTNQNTKEMLRALNKIQSKTQMERQWFSSKYKQYTEEMLGVSSKMHSKVQRKYKLFATKHNAEYKGNDNDLRGIPM